jgi:hypothetical protein
MTYDTLLKLAAEASPELMEKSAYAIKLAERLDPESVEEIVGDFREIAERLDTHIKVAGAGQMAKDIITGVGVATAGALGLAVATDLYSAARRGLTKGRNWKRMLDANPSLLDPHDPDGVHNQARLRSAFNSIHRFAPELASDPLAAGAAVRQLADSPNGTYHSNLKNSIEIQKVIGDSHAKPFIGFLGKGLDIKGAEKGPRQGPGTLQTNHPRGG